MVLLLLVSTSTISQSWHPIGAGFIPPNVVTDMRVWNNQLFACGGILGSDTAVFKGMAKWDGTFWTPVGGNFKFGAPKVMIDFNGELIAAGYYQNIDNLPNTKSIAAWNGVQWDSLGGGITDGSIEDMVVYSGSLYVGGNINQISNQPLIDLGRWDGSSWFPVCSLSLGLSEIFALEVFNNELYIGGYFYSINGAPMYNIAKFDGTNWSDVGGGLNGDVFDLLADTINNRLYASGNFNATYGATLNVPTNVAYWDGVSWTPVGTEPTLWPKRLHIYQNQLYASSNFQPIKANGDTLNFLSIWDGSEWQNLTKPLNNVAYGFAEYGNKLAVGGGFTQAGDSLVNLVAFMDNTPTSIQSSPIDTSDELQILPNPNSGQFTIYFHSTQHQFKQLELSVSDITGKVVYQQQVQPTSDRITIDLTGLVAKGIYVLHLDGEGVRKTGKLVVE